MLVAFTAIANDRWMFFRSETRELAKTRDDAISEQVAALGKSLKAELKDETAKDLANRMGLDSLAKVDNLVAKVDLLEHHLCLVTCSLGEKAPYLPGLAIYDHQDPKKNCSCPPPPVQRTSF